MPLPSRKSAKELGFKVGDRFKVLDDEGEDVEVGEVVTLVTDDGSSCPYFKSEREKRACLYLSSLEPLPLELDTLGVGNVVLDSDGDERTILAVLAPGFYCLSELNDPKTYSWTATHHTLDEAGYTIKGEAPASPREVTMAEVVEKFGETVIIKKDS